MAAACSPTLSHPQRQAGWKYTDLLGLALVAAHIKEDGKKKLDGYNVH